MFYRVLIIIYFREKVNDFFGKLWRNRQERDSRGNKKPGLLWALGLSSSYRAFLPPSMGKRHKKQGAGFTYIKTK
jgi:hypothetical protein